MAGWRVVDVIDAEAFALLPPCADPSFDHRTCDYWEDAVAGSKAHRVSWLRPRPAEASAGGPSGSRAPNRLLEEPPARAPNPFLDEASRRGPAFNPFDPRAPQETTPVNPFAPQNPFALDHARAPGNPFAPRPARTEGPGPGAPRKLALLTRGHGIFGSYARVMLVGERPVAYCQFGPLSAYPRALLLRDLYPQLPSAPLPAVITCIATTAQARRRGYALALVDDVCSELAQRGFAAVEVYPEAGARPDATSAAFPAFWERAGFVMAVADEHFPVLRREL